MTFREDRAVALAPAGKGDFFRGKSDLRWLEAGALGIPTIADPPVYWRVEHGVTGFRAARRGARARRRREAGLEGGENVKAYVQEERHMPRMAEQWREVICEVLETQKAA